MKKKLKIFMIDTRCDFDITLDVDRVDSLLDEISNCLHEDRFINFKDFGVSINPEYIVAMRTENA